MKTSAAFVKKGSVTTIRGLPAGRRATISGRLVELAEELESTQSTRPRPKQQIGTVDDGTGQIKVLLFTRDLRNIKIGDQVRVIGGVVESYRGARRMRGGRVEKIM